MRKLIITLVLICTVPFINSCDIANQLLNEVVTTDTSLPLTEGEVVKGLKRALTIGAETASKDLSIKDAFFKSAYKIFLPEEASIIVDNKDHALLKAIGVSGMIDDVELRLNTAAENAVILAKPIFVDAVTSMSIQDAFGILRGSDTAACNYLRRTTYDKLYNMFKPEVANVLNEPLVMGISTNKAWNDLTGGYNKVAKYVPGWSSVNTNLDSYVTQKALTALFEEIKKEEKKIRTDPAARVEDILKRVFG